MTQYRKKPVVIEAHQFNNKYNNPPPDWLIWARMLGVFQVDVDRSLGATGATIQTLEGPMTACIDDWIIKGVKGEIYPCKPDIFALTYEEVEQTTSAWDQ